MKKVERSRLTRRGPLWHGAGMAKTLFQFAEEAGHEAVAAVLKFDRSAITKVVLGSNRVSARMHQAAMAAWPGQYDLAATTIESYRRHDRYRQGAADAA